jgi:hypothetical protein
MGAKTLINQERTRLCIIIFLFYFLFLEAQKKKEGGFYIKTKEESVSTRHGGTLANHFPLNKVTRGTPSSSTFTLSN